MALLAWYAAMGADEAIGDAPGDGFGAGDTRDPGHPAPRPSIDVASPPEPRTVRPRPVESQARRTSEGPSAAAIANAGTLAELQALVEAFDGCSLKRTAKSLCFFRGSENAKLMLIGEAPGRDEDLQGKPFVGRAGQLLDKMLAAIGLDEESVYITNTVYWRPPGNRTPTPQEIAACEPFLTRQIALLRPKVILLLGGAAASSMLKTSQGIMRLRGKWKSYDGAGEPIPMMATLHPAYLLRNSSAKRKAWQDLLMVKRKLADD